MSKGNTVSLYGKSVQVKLDQSAPEMKEVSDKLALIKSEDGKESYDRKYHLLPRDKEIIARHLRPIYIWQKANVDPKDVERMKAKGWTTERPKGFEDGKKAPGTPKPHEVPGYYVPPRAPDSLNDELAEPVTAAIGD